MAIPDRQTGQASSIEAQLLHQISKQLDRLIREVAASYTHTTTTTTTTL